MAGKDERYDDSADERERGTSGTDESRDDWRSGLLAAARELFDDDRLGRFQAHAADIGRIGDVVVAAHLDDLRLVEQARFHRARRDAGRALAVGGRQERSLAQQGVRRAGAELGLVRLQRDLATESRSIPDKDEGSSEQSE